MLSEMAMRVRATVLAAQIAETATTAATDSITAFTLDDVVAAAGTSSSSHSFQKLMKLALVLTLHLLSSTTLCFHTIHAAVIILTPGT